MTDGVEGNKELRVVSLQQAAGTRSPRTAEKRLSVLQSCADSDDKLILARCLCTDGDSLVRNEATEILGELGSRLDRYRLEILCQDRSWVVRASADESLWLVVGEAAGKILLDAVANDKEPTVRKIAAIYLAELGDAESLSGLLLAADRERSGQAKAGIYCALAKRGVSEYIGKTLGLLDSDQRLGGPSAASFPISRLPCL